MEKEKRNTNGCHRRTGAGEVFLLVSSVLQILLVKNLDYELRVVPNAEHRWNPTWGEFTTMWWMDSLTNRIQEKCKL